MPLLPASIVPGLHGVDHPLALDRRPWALPLRIIEWFVSRWSIEVTCVEIRRHLGVETQRQ